jgi:hypothetical protein
MDILLYLSITFYDSNFTHFTYGCYHLFGNVMFFQYLRPYIQNSCSERSAGALRQDSNNVGFRNHTFYHESFLISKRELLTETWDIIQCGRNGRVVFFTTNNLTKLLHCFREVLYLNREQLRYFFSGSWNSFVFTCIEYTGCNETLAVIPTCATVICYFLIETLCFLDDRFR